MGTERSVKDKVTMVTGAASGMGRAIAELFTGEGARVAATDRDAGGGVIALDVSDAAAVDRVVAEIVAELGPIDILVNCAGVSLPAPVEADDYWRAWDATMAVNLTGYVRMVGAW